MSLPDSAPQVLKDLEAKKQACFAKLQQNISTQEKLEVFKELQEIMIQMKPHLDAWSRQTGQALQEASDELSRQAARFGLKWPR